MSEGGRTVLIQHFGKVKKAYAAGANAIFYRSSGSHRVKLSSSVSPNISAVLRRAILNGCPETDNGLLHYKLQRFDLQL